MKELGIIGPGYRAEVGIGAVDMKRIQAFHDLAVAAKIIEPGSVDDSKVATNQFVNKKVGMDLVK